MRVQIDVAAPRPPKSRIDRAIDVATSIIWGACKVMAWVSLVLSGLEMQHGDKQEAIYWAVFVVVYFTMADELKGD